MHIFPLLLGFLFWLLLHDDERFVKKCTFFQMFCHRKKTWFLGPPAKFAEADVFVWITGKTTLMVEMSQKNNIVVTRWKMIEIKLELFQTCKKIRSQTFYTMFKIHRKKITVFESSFFTVRQCYQIIFWISYFGRQNSNATIFHFDTQWNITLMQSKGRKKSVARSLQKCELYHQNRRENNLLFTKKNNKSFSKGDAAHSKIQSVKSGASLANRITITVAQKKMPEYFICTGPL